MEAVRALRRAMWEPDSRLMPAGLHRDACGLRRLVSDLLGGFFGRVFLKQGFFGDALSLAAGIGNVHALGR